KYDNIFGVSNYAVDKFNGMFPHLEERTSVFYNILDGKKMKLLAIESDSFNDNFNGLRILTVGRLETEKGQDIIPAILLRLLAEGYNIRWYCIGDGRLRSELNDQIREYRLQENMILLGEKE